MRALLLAVAVAVSSTDVVAQAAPTVAPMARVYRDLERMAALGLVDNYIAGIRPLSERAIVRLLNEAQTNVDRNPGAREWAEPTIRSYLDRFTQRKLRVFDSIGVEVAQMSSPPRVAPSDDNGSIDADINPLAANRGGRPLANGTTFSIETAHSASLGRFLAIAASPRASAATRVGTRSEFTFQTANANVLFGDFAIQVGRDYVTLGQSWTGGLLLSDNSPPLDMIRIWNDRAWRVPLVSRLLGPMRGTAFVADLGAARQRHPHTRLIGYHLAALPHPQLELGVQVLDAMGGRGGQPATLWNRVLDAIPVVDAFRTKSDFQFSNKLAGVDLRWRMPRWRGFELYAEGNADDFDGRNLSRGFLADAGYIAGMSFSCLARCGRVGARAEYHQTGIRYYTHFDYAMAKDGLMLGDPLGPRGTGGYVTLDVDDGRVGRFAVNGAFEVRSGNTYRAVTTGPNDAGFHFELVERRPAEKRGRLVLSWTGSSTSMLSLQLAAGVEQVANFDFVPDANRTNWLARFSLVARPR